MSEQRSDKDNYDSSPSPRESSLSPTWDDPDEDEDDNDLEDEAVHAKKLESLKGRCRKKVLDVLIFNFFQKRFAAVVCIGGFEKSNDCVTGGL